MGIGDQTLPDTKADRADLRAKRVSALQKRARVRDSEQTLTSAELKTFMDDQWGEGEDEDR
jgi:hypothetical protein